jgi:hypothetical protein
MVAELAEIFAVRRLEGSGGGAAANTRNRVSILSVNFRSYNSPNVVVKNVEHQNAVVLGILFVCCFRIVLKCWNWEGAGDFPGGNPTHIHWKAKNNHFRFSLSLFTFFTFFTLWLFLEKWKSDFFTFFTFTFAFEKWSFHFFHFHFRFWKVIFSLFLLSLSFLKSDFFTFFTFTFVFEKWKNHFSTFTFAFEKWKNHFSRKSLKVKKVNSESDYFSRSNVCPHTNPIVSWFHWLVMVDLDLDK